MQTLELKVTRIGNSKGVRLPSALLKKYDIGEKLILEERAGEIVLHPKKRKKEKLGWEETFRQMSLAKEDGSDWDAVIGDGLSDL